MDYEKLIKYSIQNLQTFDKQDLDLLFKWYNVKTIQELAGAILIRYQKGNMNPTKVWDLYKSALLEKINSDKTYNGILDNIDQQFLEADPSKNKKYLEWIIKSYIDNGIKEFSELKTVNKALTNYEILLNKNLITDNWFKDINHFCGIHGCTKKNKKKIGLNQFLKGYSNDLYQIIEQKKGEKDVVRVYKDSEMLIVSPQTHIASCKYGAKTKWCTVEKDDPSKFIDYTEKGPLYIIIPKNPIRDNEKYQLHFVTDSFMDEMNDSISLEFLSERFPNFFEIDDFKDNFLAFFVKNDYYDKVEYFLKKGADPNTMICIDMDDTWECKETPLLLLANNNDMIQLLLRYGANPNATDENGNSILFIGIPDLNVQLLIDAGIYLEHANDSGETALLYSIKNFDNKMTEKLIDIGANVNASSNSSESALLLGAINNDYKLMKKLIKAGADINATDYLGRNALQLAVLNYGGGDEEYYKEIQRIIKLLIKSGINIKNVDEDGKSGLDYLTKYGFEHLLDQN